MRDISTSLLLISPGLFQLWETSPPPCSWSLLVSSSYERHLHLPALDLSWSLPAMRDISTSLLLISPGLFQLWETSPPPCSWSLLVSSSYERHLHLPALDLSWSLPAMRDISTSLLDLSWSLPNAGRNVLKYNSCDQLITQMGELYVTAIFRMEDELGMSCLWAVWGHGLIEWTECLPVPIVFCWLFLRSAILCSQEDSLHLHVILHEWLAFYSAFLNIHRSGIFTVLTWLVPHKTAAILVHSV